MKNTQLAGLLATLSDKEIKLLKKWIASPFFNQRQDVMELFNYYLQYQKKHQSTPSKEEVFDHLFPNQNYDDHKVRLVMSFLKRLLEQFLVYQVNQENEFQQKLILAKIYRTRKLEKQSKQHLKEAEKRLGRYKERSSDYFHAAYNFHAEKLEHEKFETRSEANSIQPIMDHLDSYYLSRKLMFATIGLASQYYFNVKYNLGLLNIVAASFEKDHPKFNAPSVNCFYAAFRALSSLNKEDYKVFKSLLFEQFNIFNKEEQGYLVSLAISFCMRLVYQGQTQYFAEMQELHEYALENRLFDDMTHHEFKNIVNAGLCNRKLDWVGIFIDEYGVKLEKEYQPMVNMSKADLAYFRGQYNDCLKLIRETKFNDVFNSLNAKVIVLRCLYTLEEWEALSSHLKTYEVYIRRHTEIGDRQEYYLSFGLFLKKIINLNPYDKIAKQQLREELNNNESIRHMKWLQEIL